MGGKGRCRGKIIGDGGRVNTGYSKSVKKKVTGLSGCCGKAEDDLNHGSGGDFRDVASRKKTGSVLLRSKERLERAFTQEREMTGGRTD